MRRTFLLPALVAASLLLLASDTLNSPVSAQIKRGRPELTRQKDLELAGAIRSVTNRTATGRRIEHNAADGISSLDLGGTFQNVMLAKLGYDGEPVAACVTDLAEANSFLGRDLETGKPVASIDFLRESVESQARRHGMSVDEYNFYSRLASDYASQQANLVPAGATFNIINNDGAGEGFNDATAAASFGEGGNSGATRGQQRLNVFNSAAAIWGSFLDSTVATNISAQFNSIPGCTTSGGVLGSAGATQIFSFNSGAPYNNTWYHYALANKLFGSDINASPEISAQFNSDVDTGCLGAGTRFYYGLDNATPAGRVNLFVVVLHEIGHGVGFSSFVTGSTGAFNSGQADIYSQFMYDRSVGLYWYQMTDAQRQASALNTNNVLWDGPSIRLGSGSQTAGRDSATGRLELFNPNPLQSGSSISHFSTAAFPDLLMEPVINSGLPIDLDLTRQLMRDIGWYRDANGNGVRDTVSNVQPSSGTKIIGSSVNVTWTNGDGFNKNVTIEYSIDGGTTYKSIAGATNIPNTGTYAWTVPNDKSAQVRVRVREAGFADPAGVSSANFGIDFAPTAAAAGISGRVVTADGTGINGVSVYVTDDDGTRYVSRTNGFGYYSIAGLTAGRTYILQASRKSYSFEARTVNLGADLADIDIVGVQ